MARYILLCGAGAAIASMGATAALARMEGKPALQPINSSSHWLWGEAVGKNTRLDAAHTGIGAATNLGAGLFWGTVLGFILDSKHPTLKQTVGYGIGVGAVAGALDYGIMPKRLTPGWELALSRRSVVLTFGAMTAGLVMGGLTARALEDSRGSE
ncbi:hypothetical protein [Pelagibacterium sp. H642]|uniref:hypothetical protein n=1 Tax=Pelagibacterium sp. H642 TaxID=1881069 RepID=UPI002815B5B0|nr:hypothetical protein [Pelagibacterium sp. H642]WMT92754.1 hypothetical protein NO934_18325 [Pelagibacterium sp. H642]